MNIDDQIVIGDRVNLRSRKLSIYKNSLRGYVYILNMIKTKEEEATLILWILEENVPFEECQVDKCCRK